MLDQLLRGTKWLRPCFKRAAATAAAFIAIGSAAAVSIPAADAATTTPTVSHSVQHPGWDCGYGGYCPNHWGGGGWGYPRYGGGYYHHYWGPHYWHHGWDW